MSFAGYPAQPERIRVVMHRLLWSAALLLGFWLLSAIFSGSATAAENSDHRPPPDSGLLPGIGRFLPDPLAAPADSLIGTVNGVVAGVSRPLDRVLPGGKAVSAITGTLRRTVLSPVVHTLAPVLKPVSRTISPPPVPATPPGAAGSPGQPKQPGKPLPGKEEPVPPGIVQMPVQTPAPLPVTAGAAIPGVSLADIVPTSAMATPPEISRSAHASPAALTARDDSRVPTPLPSTPDNPPSPAPANVGSPGAAAISAALTGAGPDALAAGRSTPWGPVPAPLWRARKPGTRPD